MLRISQHTGARTEYNAHVTRIDPRCNHQQEIVVIVCTDWQPPGSHQMDAADSGMFSFFCQHLWDQGRDSGPVRRVVHGGRAHLHAGAASLAHCRQLNQRPGILVREQGLEHPGIQAMPATR